ncbi:adenosyl cobinamide kinase/adenosyl cobinamide phosphate guanylyltransferase [Xenococcus sp. PCC 7305]|uniref:bifunctional adenosylcobinamide kinase/adenosylcobinamide-phosphate guanylyltransferase n=1 Tax=Xenococcus sp. PCC 7305 TaxID=102125 RepID=UPI0002AC737D|nr:bifunctional adenosylcobinamide kinase/adenosylcobinamide-phosphate guanylyltransferase [Xenococcus sp. PCC 7305]ELS03784.1 adenosyl cobinamide kinase/adenosyl cobinamide phosphate guanylyltransferase [Xenococcus sp. PCC 7305]
MSGHKNIILVTGGSRSGKSEWAESLATNSNKQVIYVATATLDPTDQEWQARILKHQQRRPTNWQTVTENKNLGLVIKQAASSQCLLIDSLGTWVANFLDLETNAWQKITDRLLDSLNNTQGTIILVGEETGWGIVPAYKSGRIFRDRLGHLTRQIGTRADTTYLVVGGHALNLSVLGTPLGIDP